MKSSAFVVCPKVLFEPSTCVSNKYMSSIYQVYIKYIPYIYHVSIKFRQKSTSKIIIECVHQHEPQNVFFFLKKCKCTAGSSICQAANYQIISSGEDGKLNK